MINNLNPLNAELNPIRHLLALVGARHIVHVSRIRVKILSIWKGGKQTVMKEINAASRNRMVTVANLENYFRDISKYYLPAPTWELKKKTNKHLQ
jgi:hypothetical protein